MTLEEKVIGAYADGSELGLIVESFNITYKQVTQILASFKEANKGKRSYSDEFKRVIAERDMNGIDRTAIRKELEINSITIKKACEQFGQSSKNKASSENEYTRIEGEVSKDICPSCKSRKNNIVDEETTYCMDCGKEHVYKTETIQDGEEETTITYALKVNWEYVE